MGEERGQHVRAHYLGDALVQRRAIIANHELRVRGRLVNVIDACKALDDARARLLVQALGVAGLTHLHL